MIGTYPKASGDQANRTKVPIDEPSGWVGDSMDPGDPMSLIHDVLDMLPLIKDKLMTAISRIKRRNSLVQAEKLASLELAKCKTTHTDQMQINDRRGQAIASIDPIKITNIAIGLIQSESTPNLAVGLLLDEVDRAAHGEEKDTEIDVGYKGSYQNNWADRHLVRQGGVLGPSGLGLDDEDCTTRMI